MWGIADDNYATLPNRPGWLKAQVFPYESVNVDKCLSELENTEDIVKFEHDGREYWYIPSFFKHQKIDHPSKPKYPKYHRTLAEPSPKPRPQSNIKEPNVVESKVQPIAETKPKKELTDIQKVVRAYQVKMGCGDDAGWNGLNFKKCASYAKKLLVYFNNDWKEVVRCIDEKGGEFQGKGLDWSLSAICNWAAEWKLKKEKRNA